MLVTSLKHLILPRLILREELIKSGITEPGGFQSTRAVLPVLGEGRYREIIESGRTLFDRSAFRSLKCINIYSNKVQEQKKECCWIKIDEQRQIVEAEPKEKSGEI